jgi:Cyclin, N-terminal domain
MYISIRHSFHSSILPFLPLKSLPSVSPLHHPTHSNGRRFCSINNVLSPHAHTSACLLGKQLNTQTLLHAHPYSPIRPGRTESQQSHAPSPPFPYPDPFYGHEYTARLCARFIVHLFGCPEYPPSIRPQVGLPHFIAYTLHCSKLHSSVTFAALVLLQRLKARFPTASDFSGHYVFITAFMIASKTICNDTYSNKDWSTITQGMFSARRIKRMKRDMRRDLEWEVTVDDTTLAIFETMVKLCFGSTGSYATNVSSLGASTSPIPSFRRYHPFPPQFRNSAITALPRRPPTTSSINVGFNPRRGMRRCGDLTQHQPFSLTIYPNHLSGVFMDNLKLAAAFSITLAVTS